MDVGEALRGQARGWFRDTSHLKTEDCDTLANTSASTSLGVIVTKLEKTISSVQNSESRGSYSKVMERMQVHGTSHPVRVGRREKIRGLA